MNAAGTDGRSRESKRIAVLGAGANGASIGADLIAAGLDVALIEQWPAHVERMRAEGLRIEMPERTLEVPVRAHHLCEVAELREPFDVVLVLVKAYDTRWACELIKPLVAPDGLVAGVQNGMTTEAIADVVGPGRAVGCVIEIAAKLAAPAWVERHSPPPRSWFAVGSPGGAAEGREFEVAELLGHSGEVEVVEDIGSAKWMKLISNATGLVTTAILGGPILTALKHEGMRDFMVATGQEALAAGLARGHSVTPIFGLGQDDVDDPGGLVERMIDKVASDFVGPTTTSTVFHDWDNGRRSEVDEINGLVVAELGAAAAPANAAVVEVAHRIEAGELGPGPENYALLIEELKTQAAWRST
jgi:2-dehydropantoate 2-reductase